MKIVADFHIHSKYSRATSRDMEVLTLARYAEKKGIHLLGTGDFTHPKYFEELRGALEPHSNGLFKLRRHPSPVSFVLSAEVSNIYSVHGKVKRVHNVLLAPSFEVVEKINAALGRRGNLASDGRPIFGMDVCDLVKLIFDISPDCLIVPAHAWTPWFSVFGSQSGFDSLEECFRDQTPNIYAIETGLSSDPAMNWRLSKLDSITLLSNSDAHSPGKIGREANVFDCGLDYFEILKVIRRPDPEHFLFTVEFYPAEGKYHLDGHRDCKIVFEPGVSREHGYMCPECGKPLTIGVMHRVEALADRPAGLRPEGRIPFKNMVPLDEIIAAVLEQGVATKAVNAEYERLLKKLGPEFSILFDSSETELRAAAPERVAEGILRVRRGEVEIEPGYDGSYGKIKLFSEKEAKTSAAVSSQGELF